MTASGFDQNCHPGRKRIHLVIEFNLPFPFENVINLGHRLVIMLLAILLNFDQMHGSDLIFLVHESPLRLAAGAWSGRDFTKVRDLEIPSHDLSLLHCTFQRFHSAFYARRSGKEREGLRPSHFAVLRTISPERLDTIPMMKNLLLTAVILISLCSCGADPPAEKDNQVTPSQPGPAQPKIQLQGGIKRDLTATEKSQVVDKILQARARQQAAGLGTGSIKVNNAWNYTGYSYLSPNPEVAIEVRLVAVDITASGHTVFFDFDDIEIVDGETSVSYGSDPHAVPLNLSDGKIMPPEEVPATAPRASRWLMIYAFPKNTKQFHLYYWGQQLTLQPVDIKPKGWELPYPEK